MAFSGSIKARERPCTRKEGKIAELRGTAGKKNRGLQEEKTGGEKGRTAGTERRDSKKKGKAEESHRSALPLSSSL